MCSVQLMCRTKTTRNVKWDRFSRLLEKCSKQLKNQVFTKIYPRPATASACTSAATVRSAIDSPGWTSTPSHKCQGCQELTSIMRRLTIQLQVLLTEVHRMAAASAGFLSCLSRCRSHSWCALPRISPRCVLLIAVPELLSQEHQLVLHLRTAVAS